MTEWILHYPKEDLPDGVLEGMREGLASLGWSWKMFEDDLKLPYSYYLCVGQGDELWGFLSGHHLMEEFNINHVYVKPGHRRRGLGQRLLTVLIQEAQQAKLDRLILEVRSSNLVAQGLYEGMGFEEIARRSNYYRNPQEDAVIMERRLKEGSDESD